MSEVIRNFEWSKTSIGAMEFWPVSLRGYVNMLLSSRFPMMLMWGKELLCFYNDAFRPSLGNNGKHPAIVGMPVQQAWKETWEISGPLVECALAGGEASWSQDQLVPIFRNGGMENVYWTFSHSPLIDDGGTIAGVLVTCTETTRSVLQKTQLEESNLFARSIIDDSSVAQAVYLGEHMVIDTANRKMLELMGRDERILGLPLLEALPELKATPTAERLRQVYGTGETFRQAEEKILVMRHGEPYVGYYDFDYRALRNTEGNIYGVVNTATEITEQVMARQQTETDRQSLEMAIHIGDLGDYRINLLTGTATYSSQIQEWFGLDGNGEKLEEVFARIHANDRERVETAIADSLKNESVGRHDITYCVPEGGKGCRYLHSVGQVQWEGGIPTAILGIIQDVTRPVESLHTLEESEARFRNVIEQTPAPTLVLRGDDFIIEHINRPMLEMMGRGKEVIGRPMLAIMPELEGQYAWEKVKGVYQMGESFDQWEVMVPHNRTGVLQNYYYNVSYRPLKENDQVTGMIQVAMDVTEQVMAQRKIKEQAAALRNAVEIAELGAWTMDLTSGAITYSERHADMFGTEKIELNFLDAIAPMVPEDLDRVTRAFSEAQQPGGTGRYEAEYRVVNPRTGRQQVLRALGQTYFDDSGIPIRIAGTTQDITLQRETQAALEARVMEQTAELAQGVEDLAEANASLEKTNAELSRSNRNLEEFAHVASHDLKEPIRKVAFFTDLLQAQLHGKLTETQTATFVRITNAAERMTDLIDDLLTFSYVSERPVETEPVDLNQKLLAVLEDLELDIRQKHANVNIGILPVIQGYRRQLQQLFQNLLSNALKYSRPNVPPVIDVTSSTVERDGRLYHLITVQDNGIGFKQQYEEKIFQMFARLHGKHEYSGTGVGLSIVRKIVENHNGFAEASGVPGVGATFSIYFPA